MNTEMKARHTLGAFKIADILLNGEDTLDTTWGRMTREGLADLIDQEHGHAPELLTLAQCVQYAEDRRQLANRQLPVGEQKLNVPPAREDWEEIVRLASSLARAQGEAA